MMLFRGSPLAGVGMSPICLTADVRRQRCSGAFIGASQVAVEKALAAMRNKKVAEEGFEPPTRGL